ncbi:fumarylacetoacetate hydrolase family protein [Paenibacillus radicis (ex Gao et al. 2016)]|uniref:2-hydroxyhepta-2,4-diene-1,7-dioate isomerase n=1 Tax=Paenibacillus radicis (ex Gao et al. 2016) TaxID=1737354 RepID=A0A917GX77_9BACL|nr:fumarylacetoacetate hydrolase family protein [Paenibacillus radicis (ex Gao et al. 2016)]GGG59688.1 2-hydroxyhepta-2,4-diene-1,7-dioate isomerase [Paenibacillus radicis (ex Gao et al. 2016)]
MKLVTIERNGTNTLGVKLDEGIVDIQSALQHLPANGVSSDVMDVIGGGEAALATLKDYLQRLQLTNEGKENWLLNETDVSFGPCVTKPGKIICVGLNYRKHAAETNAAIPEYPILFNKFNNSLTGYGKDIALPERVTSEVDYEVELVIVMGKPCKYASKDEALNHVFGYCNANDLSARDLQMRTPQWLLGKTCDGFGPVGPYLVTADEVPNPNDLEMKCTVNGEVRQHSNTSDMIFHCDEIVSYISQHMTLEPGDLILTGTPEGVVLGYPAEKRVYLKPGDIVTVEIERLGTLTNRMVSEQELV